MSRTDTRISSANATGVWFGTSSNTARALLYHVHPSDARVFDIAIAAASGETDSKSAAKKISIADEQLFKYSLNYHTDDVIKLLTQFNAAQCADDSAMLTGLRRSVGIPAHPVTADAGLETGAANRTFDTWVELLVPNPSQPEWLVLHPRMSAASQRSRYPRCPLSCEVESVQWPSPLDHAGGLRHP